MRTIVAIFLILHGLVHAILAMVPDPNAPEVKFATFFSQSWVLNGLGLSESAGRLIAMILAALATIGFVATGLALLDILVPFDWWRTLVIASAVVSLVLLIIFWNLYLVIGVRRRARKKCQPVNSIPLLSKRAWVRPLSSPPS
jgi:hypothetical protein